MPKRIAIALLVLVACDPAPAPMGGRPAPERSSPFAWSRAEAPAPSASGSSSASAAVPSTQSALALAEILQAVPADRLPATGPDGGSSIGVDTDQPLEDAGTSDEPPSPDSKRPFVALGEATEQPRMSSAGIERALRAELYWPLVQRCRDPAGAILPPDSVTLEFRIEADGRIAPSSIVAKASGTSFEEAADCMRRELASAAFTGPAAALGATTHVTATIPSVD